MPLFLPLAGGKTLEGVMDLVYLDGDTWTVLDFKTDAELASSQSRYERQVQWYAYGLAKLTGLPARGILLRA
jgi:ATP-dependent exoDNAse (exonuclease V) beta subunit